MEIIYDLLLVIFGYIVGSIPFAYTISRIYGTDIRKVGDLNVGAFNVFRHVGIAAGIATLILDILKGASVIIVARLLDFPILSIYFTGMSAVIGHNWSIFLKFKGGRGVSVTCGVLFVLIPIEMFITFVAAIIVIILIKNSLLAGIFLFVPLPALCWIMGEPYSVIIYATILACITGLTHWITTKDLTSSAREESKIFWIASNSNINKKPDDNK